MDLGLKNKVAVITGGSVGIGLAVAKGLAAEAPMSPSPPAAPSGWRRRARRSRALPLFGSSPSPATSRLPKASAELVRAAEKEGLAGADILVNNAGTGSSETIMEAGDAKWQYYWELHVMAAVRLSRGQVPSMRRLAAA